MKRCTKCKALKPVTEFAKNRSRPDGLFIWCRQCAAEQQRKWMDAGGRENRRQYARTDKRRAKMAEYAKTDRAKETHEQYVRSEKGQAVQQRYRESKEGRRKIAARSTLNNYIANGRIMRVTTCQKCGSTVDVEAHHWSYRREHWFDVLWLCMECHAALHEVQNRKLREVPA